MEFKADKFSVNMGYGKYLRSALIRIHVQNSSNLNPDWMYAKIKFDHPGLVERLNDIDKFVMEYVKKNSTKTPNNRV